jgi:hypothetical protein
MQQAVDLAPQRADFLADLAYVHALGGRTADARQALRRAGPEPFEAYSVARAYVALGEPDSAFAWLDRSNFRWPHRAILADPALDPIRGDPRFRQLRERIEREMGMR